MTGLFPFGLALQRMPGVLWVLLLVILSIWPGRHMPELWLRMWKPGLRNTGFQWKRYAPNVLLSRGHLTNTCYLIGLALVSVALLHVVHFIIHRTIAERSQAVTELCDRQHQGILGAYHNRHPTASGFATTADVFSWGRAWQEPQRSTHVFGMARTPACRNNSWPYVYDLRLPVCR